MPPIVYPTGVDGDYLRRYAEMHRMDPHWGSGRMAEPVDPLDRRPEDLTSDEIREGLRYPNPSGYESIERQILLWSAPDIVAPILLDEYATQLATRHMTFPERYRATFLRIITDALRWSDPWVVQDGLNRTIRDADRPYLYQTVEAFLAQDIVCPMNETIKDHVRNLLSAVNGNKRSDAHNPFIPAGHGQQHVRSACPSSNSQLRNAELGQQQRFPCSAPDIADKRHNRLVESLFVAYPQYIPLTSDDVPTECPNSVLLATRDGRRYRKPCGQRSCPYPPCASSLAAAWAKDLLAGLTYLERPLYAQLVGRDKLASLTSYARQRGHALVTIPLSDTESLAISTHQRRGASRVLPAELAELLHEGLVRVPPSTGARSQQRRVKPNKALAAAIEASRQQAEQREQVWFLESSQARHHAYERGTITLTGVRFSEASDQRIYGRLLTARPDHREEPELSPTAQRLLWAQIRAARDEKACTPLPGTRRRQHAPTRHTAARTSRKRTRRAGRRHRTAVRA